MEGSVMSPVNHPSDTLFYIEQLVLLIPVGVVMYGSGLLLWPFRRWFRRNKVRGKWLGSVFLAQLVCYVVVACGMVFIHVDLFYNWYILLLELNLAFTIAGVVAWSRDARYERRQEASHGA